MDKSVRIPVNVKSKTDRPEIHDPDSPIVSDARPTVSPVQGVQDAQAGNGGGRDQGQPDDRRAPAQSSEQTQAAPARPSEVEEWRDRALRLQAEMENYRKRQQRLAQDQMQADRERLLRSFLPVIDNLERALAAPPSNGGGLREGVELTHRVALQLLQSEDVQRIQGKGQPFDPNWQEAVTTVDHRQVGVEPNTVVDVLEPGYRYRDQLLRPARVVVAV